MPNPLYNTLGGNRSNDSNGITQLVEKFNEFKRGFQGDPRAEVQRLLNTGQMTQEQYNQLQTMANQLMKFINSK